MVPTEGEGRGSRPMGTRSQRILSWACSVLDRLGRLSDCSPTCPCVRSFPGMFWHFVVTSFAPPASPCLTLCSS